MVRELWKADRQPGHRESLCTDCRSLRVFHRLFRMTSIDHHAHNVIIFLIKINNTVSTVKEKKIGVKGKGKWARQKI